MMKPLVVLSLLYLVASVTGNHNSNSNNGDIEYDVTVPVASMRQRPALFFRDESEEVRFCGCEEKSTLDELKTKIMTPADYRVKHGKLRLGEVDLPTSGGTLGSDPEQCGNLCMIYNSRTTHFVKEADGACQCYSDLRPFHCDEEEGAELSEVYCIEKVVKRSRNRPMLPMLRKSHNDLETTTARRKKSEVVDEDLSVSINLGKSTTTSPSASLKDVSTKAVASLVLFAASLLVIAMLMVKTWHDNKKKRREQKSLMKSVSTASTTLYTSSSSSSCNSSTDGGGPSRSMSENSITVITAL